MPSPWSCRSIVFPSALHKATIVRHRLLEEAISSWIRNLIDAEMSSLGTSVRGSLACLPADPLLWLVPFWHESARTGFKPQSIAYLRLSYRLGPNHGWVIWQRSTTSPLQYLSSHPRSCRTGN